MKKKNVNKCNVEAMSPRPLILRLLMVAENGVLTVSDAVRAGALFEISENSLRVMFARLTQSGYIEIIERGAYRLGPEGRKLGADVAAWRSIEDRLTVWKGGWIAVVTGGLSRSNRKALRTRERALTMLGMLELDSTLFIRPNNLRGGVSGVRERLASLGLGEEAAVFQANKFDHVRQKKALALWDATASAESYQSHKMRLNDWLTNVENLPLRKAAEESYLLGDEAIRRIVFDPMLPAPLVDETARHNFIEMVKQIDAKGRGIWASFLSSPSPNSET